MIPARDGLQGLAKAESAAPDLVLLDFQLPGMDGMEVLAKLKASPITREIPVLAVTSYAMVGDRERFLAAGCSGCLEKPINPDTFLREVESFLSSGK